MVARHFCCCQFWCLCFSWWLCVFVWRLSVVALLALVRASFLSSFLGLVAPVGCPVAISMCHSWSGDPFCRPAVLNRSYEARACILFLFRPPLMEEVATIVCLRMIFGAYHMGSFRRCRPGFAAHRCCELPAGQRRRPSVIVCIECRLPGLQHIDVGMDAQHLSQVYCLEACEF